MQIDNDTLIFSSGRRVYANCGIIGLDPKLEISTGYDDGISYEGTWDDLLPADLLELANFMIDQWSQVRQFALAKQNTAS